MSSSLLELLMRQQTDGGTGVRIELFPTLSDPISANSTPFHFYGLHGQTNKAVLHYAAASASSYPPGPSKALPCSPAGQLHLPHTRFAAHTQLHSSCPTAPHAQAPQHRSLLLAAVAANGVNGRTTWSRDLRVSAKDVALLAGHSSTAEALQHIQANVPLLWHRDNHHLFPAHFRAEMRGIMEALVTSAWFAALPGAIRLAVVESVAQDLARHCVWGMVPDTLWSKAARAAQGLPVLALESEEEEALGCPSSVHGAQAEEPAAGASEQEGEGQGERETGYFENNVQGEGEEGHASPQLVIRLEPRFAMGAGGVFGRRPRPLGRWSWLLRTIFPIAMWGLSLKVSSKREALLAVVAYLAGASCVL